MVRRAIRCCAATIVTAGLSSTQRARLFHSDLKQSTGLRKDDHRGQAHELDIEIKEVLEPTDKTRIFNRLLRIQNDYDILGMSIESLPNEIVFRLRLPDFHMSEIRAIQAKSEETGFIRVDELMKLQKAGYNRPRQVPPKPQPKDRRTLRERAKQRTFVGEPRSI